MSATPAAPPGSTPAAAPAPSSPAKDADAIDPAVDRRLRHIYGAVVSSALLVFCSFHPVDLGLLAWVALVPWLLVAATETRRTAVAMSYATTVLYHLVGLSWIGLTSPEGWLVTVFLEGFYGIALAMVPLWALRRTGLPLVLTLPVVGAGLEWLRGNTPVIRFPWLLLGQTQHDHGLLIQLLDLTSVYGLSALVLCANGGIVDIALLLRARWEAGRDLDDQDRRRVALSALLPLVLVGLALAYGGWRRAEVRAALEPGPRVLIVQPDLPQSLKDAPGAQEMSDLAAWHITSTDGALARQPVGEAGRVDVIVWSETMWPYPLRDPRDAKVAAAFDEFLAQRPTFASYVRYHRERLDALLSRAEGATLIVGAADYWLDEKHIHNSVYALRAGEGVVARYDKINLVPASEYVPFKGTLLLGWLGDLIKSFVPKGFADFEPGAGPVIIQAGKFRLAPDVCFEISFPELLRRSVLPQPDGSPGADVHVCPANDAWFVRGGIGAPQETAELALARDHAIYRAIETRRPVVRCVNRGVSLVVGPTGEVDESDVVYKILKGKREVVGVDGTKVVDVKITRLSTLYLRVGDAFALLCLALGGALVVVAWRGQRLARDLAEGGVAAPVAPEPPPPGESPPVEAPPPAP